MKKVFLSAAIAASMTFACQHDNVDELAPSAALTNLSADELRVANSVGRLVSASEAYSQAAIYQKANPGSTFSVTFSRANLEAMLSQPHTVGVRAYYVKNSVGQLDLALVGIDKELNNCYVTNAMFSGEKAVSEGMLKQQMSLFETANPTAIRAIAFGSKAIYDILNRDDTAGLRFYFVADKDGNRNLMFVGVNSQLKEINKVSANARVADDGGAGGSGRPCPQYCGA